jgi:F-type H+-transporting ATPase subunit b
VIELNLAFFAQLLNFIVLILILNTFLYKPIRKILSDRRQVIESAREKTVSVDLEVQEKIALYEARLREVKAEAANMRANALKQAQAEESVLLEAARQEAMARLGTIRSRIAEESLEAKKMLTMQADVLSGEICEKVLGRSL